MAHGADPGYIHNPGPGALLAPLISAAGEGHMDVVAWLRGFGISFTCTGPTHSSTALHAAATGPVPIEGIQWLIDQGCDVNGTDYDGGTALFSAVYVGITRQFLSYWQPVSK